MVCSDEVQPAEPAVSDKPKRRWYQLSLRMLIALLTASCVFFWWDPLRLRPPPPVPIETVPRGTTAHVDVIELNEQFHPQLGRWQQVIFWSRYPDGQLHIREWKITRNSLTKDFQLDHSRHALCICTFTFDGIPFRVEAPTFRESKSAGDPELLDASRCQKPTDSYCGNDPMRFSIRDLFLAKMNPVA
jgi:hypothetical protein